MEWSEFLIGYMLPIVAVLAIGAWLHHLWQEYDKCDRWMDWAELSCSRCDSNTHRERW